jgi:hypothetical protein
MYIPRGSIYLVYIWKVALYDIIYISKPRYHYNTIITFSINYNHYNTIITLL